MCLVDHRSAREARLQQGIKEAWGTSDGSTGAGVGQRRVMSSWGRLSLLREECGHLGSRERLVGGTEAPGEITQW